MLPLFTMRCFMGRTTFANLERQEIERKKEKVVEAVEPVAEQPKRKPKKVKLDDKVLSD